VFGSADLFAVVGAVVLIALSLAALRKARPKPRVTQPVRRAASALHGESDWFPINRPSAYSIRAASLSARPAAPT